jgi:hypothetical protein
MQRTSKIALALIVVGALAGSASAKKHCHAPRGHYKARGYYRNVPVYQTYQPCPPRPCASQVYYQQPVYPVNQVYMAPQPYFSAPAQHGGGISISPNGGVQIQYSQSNPVNPYWR